ncbi:MAG: polysaccharide pyruvyl transferase family protein [Actinobacteria bacterium]|nr:polysaccharide pyruvyl transferase family protein [Actinomycetota bacterium]
MPSALLAGHFGPSGAGETATLGAFRRALPDWTPILASSDPAASAAAHDCPTVDARRPLSVVRAAARADASVLAGWSIGGAEGARPGLRTAVALVVAAKLRGRPTALLGISARGGRSAWEGRLSRRLLGAADLVVLRDELSAHHLEAAGVRGPFRIGADPAWLDVQDRRAGGRPEPWRDRNRDRREGEEPEQRPRRVVVAIEARSCPDDLVALLGDALAGLAADEVEIGLQPWHAAAIDWRDHGLVAELAGRIGRPVPVLEPLPNLGAADTTIAGAGAVVALGSHALIAAAAAGVPAVAVACEPAIADLARRLDQPLVAADASAAEVGAAIAASLDREPAQPNAVEGQIATAEEGFRLLRVLLSEGRSDEVTELSGLPLRRGPQR